MFGADFAHLLVGDHHAARVGQELRALGFHHRTSSFAQEFEEVHVGLPHPRISDDPIPASTGAGGRRLCQRMELSSTQRCSAAIAAHPPTAHALPTRIG